MEKLNYIRQSLLMMVILLWKGIQLYYDNNVSAAVMLEGALYYARCIASSELRRLTSNNGDIGKSETIGNAMGIRVIGRSF